MKSVKRLLAALLIAMLATHAAAALTPDSAELWRAFAMKVPVGSSLKVRLRAGQTFTATLVQASPEALLLQPRGRVPVPVQPVAYEAIVSLEPMRGGGIGAGKAAAIGVAAGVGAFFATLLIFIAAFGD
jgi:hypothetical protein